MKKWLSILLVVAFLIGFVAPLGEPVYAATEEDQPVYETQVEPAEETAPAEPAKPAEETAGVELPLPTETVVEDISEDESSSKMMEMRRLDANGAPALKATNEVEWIDRLADLPSYAWDFYYWLLENGDGDGQADALINPTTGTHVNNEYYAYEIVRFESQKVSFSYGSNETAQSVANAIYAEETERLRAEVRAYMLATYAAFNRDHTEVFWFGGTTRNKMERSGSYNDNRNGTGVLTFNVSIYYVLMESDFDVRASEYRNQSVIYSTIADRDNRINNLAQTAKTKGNRYEQLKYLNDWLTKNNGYNSSSNLNNILRDARNCYGALVGRKGTQGPVCEGYARALKVVCNKLGIPCVLVDGTAISGSSSGPHMWNYVQMEDGKWYAMDVTWNDPGTTDIFVSGYENENYLLVGSQTFVGDRTFIESHPVKNNVHTGSTNFTNGPVLSTTKYNPNQAVTVTKIEVKTLPSKTTYWVGESFNSSGFALTVTYSNGTTQTVSSGFTFSGFNSTSAGTKTVIVAYEGKTTSFTVTVNAVTVTKIAIKSLPTKTTYWVGESLNTSGLTLTVTYSNGTTQDISTGFTTSGFSSSTTGTKTVTVTYSGKTATFTVTINAATVTKIAISTYPTKTTYWVGESLNTSGLALTVTYSDGSTQTVSSGFTTSGFSSTTAGTKTVTISYGGKTATFTVTVKAKTPLKITTQPSGVVAKPGDTVSFTVAAQGEGVTYQWKYKNPGADAYVSSSLEGNKTPTLKVADVTKSHNGRQYICVVKDSFGERIESGAATLQIAYFETDAKDQTVEEEKYATFSVKFSITSGVTYQWQYKTSEKDDSWANSSMTGAKTNTMTVEGLEKRNGYLYRCKVTVSGQTFYSRAANLTVTERPPAIVTQPQSAIAKVGGSATFTVGTQGSGVTYQWKYKKPSSSTWSNVTSTGYKTATLKLENLTTSKNGYQYKCVVEDAKGREEETEIVTLWIAYITTDVKDQTVEDRQNATFSVAFSITEGVTYQWQFKSKADATSWSNTSMTGAKTNTLTVPAIMNRNGYLYRCKITVSGLEEPIYSKEVTLTVTERPPTIATQPESVVAKSGETVTFTVGTRGEGLTYQWKYKNATATTWSNTTLTGNKTDTLTVSNVNGPNHNGRQYKCVITDSYGEVVETEAVTLWVAYIVTDTKSKTVEEKQNATFTVDFSLTENVTYQWQYKGNTETSTWSNTSMIGAKTDTLTVPAIMDRNGYQYRCKITVTGLAEPIYSKEVTLTVTEKPPVIISQPKSVVTKNGETAIFTVGTQGEGLTYQWKYKNATATTWSNTTLTGNKTDTLTVSNVSGPNHNGRQYKCVITDSYGDIVETEAVTLWVAYIETDAKNKTVEEKQNATFTVAFSVTEGVTYQWQFKSNADATSWSNTSMTGAKTNTLTVPAIMDRNGYLYRCKITVSGLAEPIYSKVVTLTVTEKPPIIVSQPKSITAQVGDTVTFTVGTQGEGLTYQWKYKNATATTWSNTSLPGYNTSTLTVSSLVGATHNGRQYMCVVTDSEGNVHKTEPATLTVAYLINDAKSQDVKIGKNAIFKVNYSVKSGVTYQWQYRGNTASSTWANTSSSGNKTDTLTVQGKATNNRYMYRCKITDPVAGTFYSKEVYLNIVEDAPEIITQPSDNSGVCGSYVTFTVEAIGAGISYQWQWSGDGGETWSNTMCKGYSTDTAFVKTNRFNSGYMYRCVVKTMNGSGYKRVYSEPATLTVLPAAEITQQLQDTVTVKAGDTVQLHIGAEGEGLTYQWQWAKFLGSWNNTTLLGYDTDTLTLAKVRADMNGRYYRVVITNAYGGTVETKYVRLFVK